VKHVAGSCFCCDVFMSVFHLCEIMSSESDHWRPTDVFVKLCL